MTRRTESRNSMMGRGVSGGKLKGKGQVMRQHRSAPQFEPQEGSPVFFLSKNTPPVRHCDRASIIFGGAV